MKLSELLQELQSANPGVEYVTKNPGSPEETIHHLPSLIESEEADTTAKPKAVWTLVGNDRIIGWDNPDRGGVEYRINPDYDPGE